MQIDLIGKSKQFLENVRLGLNVFGSKATEVLTKTDEAYTTSVEKNEVTKEKEHTDNQSIDEISLLNASGRIDYVIQEGVLENPYLAALAVQ